MEIRHLEAFVQTVNCNSFSKAAKLMQLSQPTISSHINTLEKEMGTKLLIRTTKNMELTVKGRRFYEQVSEFLKMRDLIQQEFQDNQKEELYIDASTSSAQWVLPAIMMDFGKQNDKVKFQIRKNSNDGIAYSVRNGLTDIGLTETPIEDEICVSSVLHEYCMVIAMPATEHYKNLVKQDVPLTDLLKEPMIIQEKKQEKISDIEVLIGKLGMDKRDLNIVASLQDCAGVLQYVAGGLGIALTHEFAAAQMAEENNILTIPVPRELLTKVLYVVSSRECDNELVDAFLKSTECKELECKSKEKDAC